MKPLTERDLWEHARGLSQKEYSARELTLAYLDRIGERNGEVGAYLSVCSEEALRLADGVDEARLRGERLPPLAGIPMALKDNLCVRDLPTTCASRFLMNYRPPYDATVWQRLRDAGAVLLGKTNMDEFGMGSTTENSAIRSTLNPRYPTVTPGGSSGGSAAAVADGMAVFSLGSDTGGSVRQPAAFCGLVGMRPTYGRVSRYGLVAYASSLDTVGPITRTVRDNATVLSCLLAEDAREATSVSHPDFDVSREISGGVSGLRIGVLREILDMVKDDAVCRTIRETAERLTALGARIVECSAPSATLAAEAYGVIACAEASSNLARFDGVRYGRRAEGYADMEELLVRSRSEGFGDGVKRRILLGTYLLSGGCREDYYRRTRTLRAHIRKEIGEALDACDALLLPIAPTSPVRVGTRTKEEALQFSDDVFSAIASLCGLPALSLPLGKSQEGAPVGIQLMGAPDSEGMLYRVGACLEADAEEGGR